MAAMRVMIAIALAACTLAANGAAPAAFRVVATTTDLASLAATVGGDLVSVEAIVPGAADPEAFEPRPGDLDKVRRASLLVRVGLGYDYWLDRLVRQVGNARLMRGGAGYVDASVGIPLLEIRGETVVNESGHAHGVANPHYWLDPDNAVTVTAAIADALVGQMPAERQRIVDNRDRFLRELRARREQWQATLAPFAGARLVAHHNSWPYFARRFRLDIATFIEPKAGVAPSPAHLRKVIAEARAAHARAVLVEAHEPQDAVRYVARELNVPVVTLAMSTGAVPGANDYLALLDADVAALAKALGARGSTP
jgi:ABC-type Zn uptake system ZnuABC Zn-binding protein ZnuA